MANPQHCSVISRDDMFTKNRAVARLCDGRTTIGQPTITLLHGRVIMIDGQLMDALGWGQLVKPEWEDVST